MAPDKQSFRDVLKTRWAELDPELRRIMDGRIRDAILRLPGKRQSGFKAKWFFAGGSCKRRAAPPLNVLADREERSQ